MSTRKRVVAGNWKMNTTYANGVTLAQKISDKAYDKYKDLLDIAVFPPFTSIKGISNVFSFDNSPVIVGAQDVFYEDDGAYTGEISTNMLKDVGATWCLVGHSERRALGDTDEDVQKKVHKLLSEKMTPIICCGEPLEVYKNQNAQDYVANQIKIALTGNADFDTEIIVAYEPIWAIGTGEVSSPQHVEDIAKSIRQEAAKILGEDKAFKLRILYGGSVKPGNAGLFCKSGSIDGVLVGGASLDSDSFITIAEEVAYA